MAENASKLRRWIENLPKPYRVFRPKQENVIRNLFTQLSLWWISFPYPLIFVLIGTTITVACTIGVKHFDQSLVETDLTKLYSPMKSKTLDHQKDLMELFGANITAHDFYPHQTILQGYDLTVLLQFPGNRSFVSTESLAVVQDFHSWVTTNITVPDENGKSLDFTNLCALRDGRCVVTGIEVLDKTFLSAVENNTVPYPTFNDIDLPEIFGHVRTSNGTMISADILKLKYYLRYDTPYFKDKSMKWILKFPKNASFGNMTITAASSLLEINDVETDFPYWGVLCFMIMMSGCYQFTFAICPLGLLLLIIISVATMGAVSFLQVPLTPSWPWVTLLVMDRLYTNFEMMKKKTDSIRQEDRSRYLLITFMSIVFFGVGISSKYLIVHSFCTVACIAMVICFIVTFTVYSLHLKIAHRFTGTWTRCCCKCPSLPTANEGSTVKNGEASAERRSSIRSYCTVFFVGLLYLGYLSLAGYGLSKQPNQREFCNSQNSYSQMSQFASQFALYHNFCRTNEEAFGKDFTVTLTVKINGGFDFYEIKNLTSSVIDAAIDSYKFDKEGTINWIASYLDYTLHKSNFTESAFLTFLGLNSLYKNDVSISGSTAGIDAFRVYLKTSNDSGSTDIVGLIEASRSLERDAGLHCFFYAPDFLLYEGFLTYSADFYKIASRAGSILGFSLVLGFYHYYYAILLGFVTLASILFGVVGFARFFGLGLSSLSSVTVLFLCTYIFESMFIPQKGISQRWFLHLCWLSTCPLIIILFTVLKVPLMQLNLFGEIVIPVFLFFNFLSLHYVVFIPRLIKTTTEFGGKQSKDAMYRARK